MAETAYFDSNLWIACLTGEPTKPEVEALITEIKQARGTIITSILTIPRSAFTRFSRPQTKSLKVWISYPASRLSGTSLWRSRP